MNDGSSYDPSTVIPLSLVFDGTTNEEGKLVLDFKSRHAKYSFNYEVALASLGLQVNTVENVPEDQAYFQFKDTLGNLEKAVYLKAKIATVQDLITHINAHSKNKFVFFSKSSDNILQLDLKFGTLMISKRIAKSLGMLDKKGKISDFFRLLNSQTTIINRSNGNVELDGTNSKQSQNIVQFPKSLQESVWADISKYSFQTIFVDSNMGEFNFVGSQKTQNIAVIPMDPYASILHHVPMKLLYHRLYQPRFHHIYVRLASSSGTLLTGVKATVELKLRRRHLN